MTISFGGVLAGGLAGAGTATEQVAQTSIDQGNKVSLMQATQQAEADKTNAINQANAALANQQRSTMSNAISGRASQIATDNQTQGLNNFYNQKNPDGTSPDRVSTLGNADISDEEKAMNPITSANMDSARAQAAKELGYVHPDTMATTDAAITRANITSDWRQNNSQTAADAKRDVATIHTDSNETIAANKLTAFTAKAASLAPNDRAALKQADDWTKDLIGDRNQINSMNTALQTMPSSEKPAQQAKIDALTASVAKKQADRDSLLKKSSDIYTAWRLGNDVRKANAAAVGDTDPTAGSGDPGAPSAPTAPAVSASTAAGVRSALQKYQDSQRAGQ